MTQYFHDAIPLYLERMVDWDVLVRQLRGEGADPEADREAYQEVLRTCAEICAQLEPAARQYWEQTARLENGDVVLPEHVKQGYEQLRQVGLVALTLSERWGGPQLPALVAFMVLEMLARADMSLQTVIGLQMGVADDIEAFASEELCERYLPGFASGEYQGAMDLTEPHAGSDLGAITTRATCENGRYFLDGEKIFISNGGSAIHLVLARDADSFEQSKGTTNGLSLYLCPRVLPDGTANRLSVERLEHKLGLHGSATCAIRFDRAEAFLVAERGKGFRAMLKLMNSARLGVAAQGVGIADGALASALAYARERVQFGRPIAEQPLMKAMLARMTVSTEGSRALLYRCCRALDSSRAIEAQLAREGSALPEAERADLERRLARERTCVRLLTPLAKFLATESCGEVTRMAIQIHGGIGFMAETDVGKLHLDGIITTIYEGTSEIQVSFALKEIGRGALDVVFADLREELDKMQVDTLAGLAEQMRTGIEKVMDALPALIKDLNYALLCARHVAEMVIAVVVGTELLLQAQRDPSRIDLATSWIVRKSHEIDMHAHRISEDGVERIERCERILKRL